MQHKLYLSHRNILTLLSKLDGKKNGQPTACTIIKNDDEHPTHAQTLPQIAVTAVEDNEAVGSLPYSPGVTVTRTALLALLAHLGDHAGTCAAHARTMTSGEPIDIHAVEDAVYYLARSPGPMHPLNDPGLVRH